MRYALFALSVVGLLLNSVASADDAKDEAMKKHRKRIQGTWQVTALTINGNKAKNEDAQKLTVVNGDDGTWSIRVEGKEISKGTSTFDPTQKPNTIDFTPTTGGGEGDHFVGIYQLKKDTRKLCFAPAGKPRPTKFSSTADNQHILVEFKRATDGQETRDGPALDTSKQQLLRRRRSSRKESVARKKGVRTERVYEE